MVALFQSQDLNEHLSLGPVENLESYVKPDWWQYLFNANYLKTDGDVVEDETITKSEIDLFVNILNPERQSSILDLCCGQGRHSLELAKRGFEHLSGLDRSNYLVTRADTLNKQQGSKINYQEGDARQLPFADNAFDFVILAGNSFGYFESEQDDLKVLQEIIRVLKPQGKLLIDITDGQYIKENFQPRSWEWIDSKYFVCRERSLSQNQERLISREVITHVEQGVIADQFYAERLYTRNSITDLLSLASFNSIQFHTEVVTESRRNQDLGMMAQRMIISAVANKEWTLDLLNQNLKTVAVLMGDPHQSDLIKPDANFDDDDFLTISQLKEALVELPGYKFVYFDRHEKLIQDLPAMADEIDFVFNLCDEGFNNLATKELHIPALLEILDLPYTGGTPKCLAYCYDKLLVRSIAQAMDIPVPQTLTIAVEDISVQSAVDFPVIVKPNFGDSSWGITQDSVCYNLQMLEKAILQVREKLGYSQPILVEQFLEGKDISVGIIGNPQQSYTALPIIEEDYASLPPELPRICGYEAKWLANSPYGKITSVPANLPPETEQFLIASCVKLFERLECQDYARFDWRLDANNIPRLLEVNPNPGWCWDGHLAKMAQIADISYVQMLGKILEAGETRIVKQNLGG